MHGKLIRLSLIALFLFAAVGCGNASNPPQAQSTPAATEATLGGGQQGSPSAYPAPANSAYPGPAAQGSDAYPEPSAPQPVEGAAPQPIPQPAAGMAVVHGKIYDSSTDQPIFNGVTVYLSPVIETSSADMSAVSTDIANDANVTPDREGGFAFADVPPGRYGVVVRGPLNQYLTHYASDQSKEVILTVEAGQTVDLGKIYSGYP